MHVLSQGSGYADDECPPELDSSEKNPVNTTGPATYLHMRTKAFDVQFDV